MNTETKAGEPVRIVVSTDDNQVPTGTAAAFIATVQIVQQFVPVEVWWQGAWLNDTGTLALCSTSRSCRATWISAGWSSASPTPSATCFRSWSCHRTA